VTQPVALIVGGASGIGRATSEVLAEQGWQVAIADVQVSGDDCYTCDVRDLASVQAAVDGVAAAFGGIDLVVASAGYREPAPSSDVTDDALGRMIDIQLTGTIRCARAAYPYLRKSERASIVALSSINAHLGIPHRLAYNVAKAGLEAMVRTLAVEWAPDNIRVNAVAPAWVRTPMVQSALDAGTLDEAQLKEWLPLGRLAEPREVAETIAFLASPAASYISGQSLLIDGAMTVRGPWPPGADR
jgi:NAD(P)-dependent dehydrogenase (short-subunit alcohol dehydrogenase family)